MVRAKPELYLESVSTVSDPNAYSRCDLVTPPSYIASAPPPLVTPALSRSSSLSTNISQSDSDREFDDDDDDDVPLANDAAPWTSDQDEALLNTYSAHLDGPAIPLAPFEVSRPPPSMAAQISRSAIRRNGWRGRRSVASTRRRLLKLAREKYSEQIDRIEIDAFDSSSALSSMARLHGHRSPRSPFAMKLQLHGFQLASPFLEKQFDTPSPAPSYLANDAEGTGLHEFVD